MTIRAIPLLFVLLFSSAATALNVPYLSGRVVDQAQLLSSSSSQTIERELAALEQSSGAQVAVLTVPSLEGDSLEDFSMRVVEAWKLGKKGTDNGILFLIAKSDRKMRIEVGYGLEGAIPDALAKRILDTVVAPHFRSGDYGGGVLEGTRSIERLLRGEAADAVMPKKSGSSGLPLGGFPPIFIIFPLFILLSWLRFFTGYRRWGGGGWISAGSGWSSGGSGGFSGGGGSFGGGGASSSW